jgi:hypothetical protein
VVAAVQLLPMVSLEVQAAELVTAVELHIQVVLEQQIKVTQAVMLLLLLDAHPVAAAAQVLLV